MSEVEELADRIAVLFDGKIVLVEKPEEILRREGGKNLEESIRKYWSDSR
jgi:ABC-type Na+ transport system ATPase subunit NatA